MNIFSIPIFALAGAVSAGAEEVSKAPARPPAVAALSPVKPSPAKSPVKTKAEKTAESKAYLDKLVGDWGGENKYMVPSGQTVSSTVEESFKWSEDAGAKVLIFTGSNRFRFDKVSKVNGVYSITDSGDILFKFSGDGEPEAKIPSHVQVGSLVMRADENGEVKFFSSEEFSKEGSLDVRKGLGFSFVALPDAIPVKVRFSFTRKRRP